MADVALWGCDEVKDWLKENGFSHLSYQFCKEHKIDGSALLALDESDLRQPPLQMKVLGEIKHLYKKIKDLQDQSENDSNTFDDLHETSSSVTKACSRQKRKHATRGRKNRHLSTSSYDSFSDDEIIDEEVFRLINKRGRFSRKLDPEIFKTVLSFVYLFTVFLLTSFVMVIVHDRVPDVQKYPPLPDLFLDNIPYIPWAFEVCELVGVYLFFSWTIILFFHKHRFILMRRMFSMLGTIFLLRCVTMLITSLSAPGHHLHCQVMYDSMYAKLTRTYEIWSGFGMTIHGVRSCGDYMFSGHTSCITLLNFFITEYTPRKLYFIHTAAWVGNLFGIFFILAAHEHYSIDVFIAFYITSRLFLYYHTLANNRSLMLRDKNRRRVWFPLFSYFESKCDGIVPNEYEWPFPWPKLFITYFEKKFKKY